MKVVIQRVSSASVEIEGDIFSKISDGLLVFLGVEKEDSEEEADYMAKKIIDLRIFSDDMGKMNLSVKQIKGELLVISQFTLCTVEKSGNRPSFFNAENPERAEKLYEYFISSMKKYYVSGNVYSGKFAALMKINLSNDGPVTIILER
jgi:D-tyrosyl-tRNA(Tyr) deacylase